MNVVNKCRIQNNQPLMGMRTARKFVMARKFDFSRSLELYHQHEKVRFREGLVRFDPHQSPLKRELETGKFTILVSGGGVGFGLIWHISHLFDFLSLPLVAVCSRRLIRLAR